MASWSEPALQDLDLSAVEAGASRCGHVELTYRGKPLEFAIRPFTPRDAELTVCDLPPPRRCLFFGLTVSKEIADEMRRLEAAVGSRSSCVRDGRIRAFVSPRTRLWSWGQPQWRPPNANAVVEVHLLEERSGYRTRVHVKHLLFNEE
jgi:hypothetical protein